MEHLLSVLNDPSRREHTTEMSVTPLFRQLSVGQFEHNMKLDDSIPLLTVIKEELLPDDDVVTLSESNMGLANVMTELETVFTNKTSDSTSLKCSTCYAVSLTNIMIKIRVVPNADFEAGLRIIR